MKARYHAVACLLVLSICSVVFARESGEKIESASSATAIKPHILFSTASENNTLSFIQQKTIYTELFKRIGYGFELIHQPSKRSIVDANAGKVDGDAARVFDLNKEGLYPNLVRVNEPVQKMDLVAFSVDPRMTISGWKGLENTNYLVGYSHGYKIVESNLSKYVSPNRIFAATDLQQGLRMLQAGRIDLFIDILGFEKPLLQTHANLKDAHIRNAGVIETITTYPYLNRKHQDLVPSIESTFRTMKQDGTYQQMMETAAQIFSRQKE